MILTCSTFVWLSQLHFYIQSKCLITFAWNTLNSLNSKHFSLKSVSVYCQQYWKQFSMYLGENQTISGWRTNQNASGIINKSGRSWDDEFYLFFFLLMCGYMNVFLHFNVCMCVAKWFLCRVSPSCIISPQSHVCGMRYSNRLHHVPPLNHATYIPPKVAVTTTKQQQLRQPWDLIIIWQ